MCRLSRRRTGHQHDTLDGIALHHALDHRQQGVHLVRIALEEFEVQRQAVGGLLQYGLSGFTPMRFEGARKVAAPNMRLLRELDVARSNGVVLSD